MEKMEIMVNILCLVMWLQMPVQTIDSEQSIHFVAL